MKRQTEIAQHIIKLVKFWVYYIQVWADCKGREHTNWKQKNNIRLKIILAILGECGYNL